MLLLASTLLQPCSLELHLLEVLTMCHSMLPRQKMVHLVLQLARRVARRVEHVERASSVAAAIGASHRDSRAKRRRREHGRHRIQKL